MILGWVFGGSDQYQVGHTTYPTLVMNNIVYIYIYIVIISQQCNLSLTTTPIPSHSTAWFANLRRNKTELESFPHQDPPNSLSSPSPRHNHLLWVSRYGIRLRARRCAFCVPPKSRAQHAAGALEVTWGQAGAWNPWILLGCSTWDYLGPFSNGGCWILLKIGWMEFRSYYIPISCHCHKETTSD